MIALVCLVVGSIIIFAVFYLSCKYLCGEDLATIPIFASSGKNDGKLRSVSSIKTMNSTEEVNKAKGGSGSPIKIHK